MRKRIRDRAGSLERAAVRWPSFHRRSAAQGRKAAEAERAGAGVLLPRKPKGSPRNTRTDAKVRNFPVGSVCLVCAPVHRLNFPPFRVFGVFRGPDSAFGFTCRVRRSALCLGALCVRSRPFPFGVPTLSVKLNLNPITSNNLWPAMPCPRPSMPSSPSPKTWRTGCTLMKSPWA